MNPERLLNIACTIHTVTESTTDAYGDPTLTTTDSDTVCWIDRRGNSGTGEESGPANWLSNTMDLYLPAGTAITGNDRVTVQSALYEVIGTPREHIHPVSTDGMYVVAQIGRVS